MPRLSYRKALTRALTDEMTRDEAVFLLGEDIRVGASNVTPGLLKRFGPDRVLDTPLSEQAFTSFATGAALAGLRPVVEFQIPSLLFLVFEQIVNHAHKFPMMTGGQCSVPVTYLVPGSGSRTGWAGQHSDHPYSLFAHVGIVTVVPATPADAYGLLASAIRHDDPVVVFAPAAALDVRDDVDFATLAPVPLGRGWSAGPATTSPWSPWGTWCTTRWPSPRSWPTRCRWRCSTRARSTRSISTRWSTRCRAPAGWWWSTTPTAPAASPPRSSPRCWSGCR